MRRATIVPALLLLARAVMAPAAFGAAPCGALGRDAFQSCASTAKEVFQAADDACLGRDHACVTRCRAERIDCVRRILAEGCDASTMCDPGFARCGRACTVGGPPGSAVRCKVDARASYISARMTCRADARTIKRECRQRIVACVKDCGTARRACGARVRDTLAASTRACNADQARKIVLCHATFPAGSRLLAICLDNAKADGVTCRADARQTAMEALNACVESFSACATACPSS